MRTILRTPVPLAGLGMASLTLGVIGLLLFFLPVLGIPISAFGVLFGILGLGAALFTSRSSLRWSLAGIGFSILALGTNLAIADAPGGTIRERSVPAPGEQIPARPFIPPPAPALRGPGDGNHSTGQSAVATRTASEPTLT